ncbi:hypothetical protein [Streptomyces sp. enrichment culture]|uniref:hypothetical protein n=1 Tax=Streptomyces sp. enrichment culture TaxID=1795815 RepID=UPI003F5797C3
MVEGEQCSPPTGDGAGGNRTGRDSPPAHAPTGDPAAERPRAGEPPSSDDLPGLPGLLALLGRLLEGHAPEEIAVLLREEIERREYAAYSHGWRDAVGHFTPLLEEARGARARPLRLVDRLRDRASVIPFPRDRHLPYAADPDLVPEAEVLGAGPAAPPGAGADTGQTTERAPGSAAAKPSTGPATPSVKRSGEPGSSGRSGDAASSGAPADSDGGQGASQGDGGSAAESEEGGSPDSSAPRHAFVPKSRSSKVPTIPKIAAPRRPRRGQGGGRSRQPSVPEDEGA